MKRLSFLGGICYKRKSVFFDLILDEGEDGCVSKGLPAGGGLERCDEKAVAEGTGIFDGTDDGVGSGWM